MQLDRLLNRRLIRALFRYYAGPRGKERIAEIFGAPRKKSPGAALARMPAEVSLNTLIKKVGVGGELKEKFLSKNYHKQVILNVMKTIGEQGLRHPFRFDAPLVIVWNVTNKCNLRCRYCYQSAGVRKTDELSFEEKIDLIDQMVDINVGFVAFSGGEPLMEPRFFDLLSYASSYLHTSVATNGTLEEDGEYVRRLADSGAKNVFVSLDGATAGSHDFIRGRGSFNRTLSGVRNLVSQDGLKTGINMVVTRRNLREVPRVLDLALRLGVNSFSHYNFIPAGRGKDDFALDLTAEEREDLMNLLYDWHARRKQTGLNIISTSPTFARVIHQRSRGKGAGVFHLTTDDASELDGIVEYAGGCGAGRVYAAVQPNGLVSPCVFMPDVIIGDVREKFLYDIWKSSEVCRMMCDRERFAVDCPDHKIVCGGCRARAFAYGNLVGPDPGCIVYQDLHGSMERPGHPRGEVCESVTA
jgi:MoaA/NifB/PqqE/SkfB family radical SAM enzyme